MRSRTRVVGGLVAVAVAIAAVVGAVMLSGGDGAEPVGAIVAVQDDHLPVDPIETIPARLDLIGDTGVTTTRVDLHWAAIAPSRPDDPRDPDRPGLRLVSRRPDHARPGRAGHHADRLRLQHARVGARRPGGARHRREHARPRPRGLRRLHGGAGDALLGRDAPHRAASRCRRCAASRSGTSRTSGLPDAPGRGRRSGSRSTTTRRWRTAAYEPIKEANPDAIVIAGVGGPAQQHQPDRRRRGRVGSRASSSGRSRSTPTRSTSTRRRAARGADRAWSRAGAASGAS